MSTADGLDESKSDVGNDRCRSARRLGRWKGSFLVICYCHSAVALFVKLLKYLAQVLLTLNCSDCEKFGFLLNMLSFWLGSIFQKRF